jgi:hypothetical protein
MSSNGLLSHTHILTYTLGKHADSRISGNEKFWIWWIQICFCVTKHGKSVLHDCGRSEQRIFKTVGSRFIGLYSVEKYLWWMLSVLLACVRLDEL